MFLHKQLSNLRNCPCRLVVISVVRSCLFFFFKGWETLFMALGEEFHVIPGRAHKRFLSGLRNVNTQRALADAAVSIPA